MMRCGWGCIRGCLLMYWKKISIEVVSCAIFAYLWSQGFVFYSDCDLTQAQTQINTDECML